MKGLVIGLGSMGIRRIRCLYELGIKDITGYDIDNDRSMNAKSQYAIKVPDEELKDIFSKNFDFCIISVPPHIHESIMQMCLLHDVPFFVEASVVNTDLKKILQLSKKQNLKIAPSSTLRFHPAIRLITSILNDASIGSVSNISYHSGQYLPDWHAYEEVSDFYVSRKETGGAREIVPFELTWIVELFGFPESVIGSYNKTIQIKGAEEIDDNYNAILRFQPFTLNITVDVVSRYATRNLIINCDMGQIRWSWENNFVSVYNSSIGKWVNHQFEAGKAHSGYNINISENMYVDEVKAFLAFLNDDTPFPNTLEKDIKVLDILKAIEISSDSKKAVEIRK
jgi:predicted dehydrogenase